jgi:hypothetical protein
MGAEEFTISSEKKNKQNLSFSGPTLCSSFKNIKDISSKWHKKVIHLRRTDTNNITGKE